MIDRVQLFVNFLAFIAVPQFSDAFRRHVGAEFEKEWMVWPLTFSAATPVGASTTAFFAVVLQK